MGENQLKEKQDALFDNEMMFQQQYDQNMESINEYQVSLEKTQNDLDETRAQLETANLQNVECEV